MKISEIKHPHEIIEIEIACPRQKISLLNIGASFVRWLTTSNVDILARYEDIQEYFVNAMYLGSTVGPNAGRIQDGHFFLNDKEYSMQEKTSHFLHSGEFGFARSIFDYQILKNTDDESEILFTLDYQHPLLPGTQNVNVRYSIKADYIKITYDVTSDQTSLCNLTNHVYMNLDGDFEHEIDSHTLKLNASKVLMMDAFLIGTDFNNVNASVFDFRKEEKVLPSVLSIKKIDKEANGLDHYYLFDEFADRSVVLKSAKSNHQLTIQTDYPGVTVYTTNYPSSKVIQTGLSLPLHSAICIEPEYIGNAINRNDVSVGLVSKEKPYHHQIEYIWGNNL